MNNVFVSLEIERCRPPILDLPTKYTIIVPYFEQICAIVLRVVFVYRNWSLNTTEC